MAEMRLSTPFTLPCGLKLPNRVAKAAMAEQMAGKNWLPTEDILRVYRVWADGGWGMQLSGNVQVTTKYLGGPHDMAIPDDVPEAQIVAAYRALNDAASSKGCPFLAQLNHPGRQSPAGSGTRSFLTKNLAPSPIPLNLGGPPLLGKAMSHLVFGTPREMTIAEIMETVAQFARAARIMAEAGLAGVQIHGAHGYLVAQFLSRRSNTRTDEYGGTARKRARFVVEVIKAVREVVPKGFAVGIKLNSVDHQSKAELGDCIQQIEEITQAGVDFIEISGGSYEDPQMVRGPTYQADWSERTKAREAFFLEFAKAIRSRFHGVVPIMVTGGFRTRAGMEAAVAAGHCELVGVGRPACLNPTLPANIVFNKAEVKDADAVLYAKRIEPPWLMKALRLGNAIGAGVESGWYQGQLQKIGAK